jgi:hypothetical protein
LVELDRATESRAAWRRKLGRYLSCRSEEPVLVLTTSSRRAKHIAMLAADVGVPLLATTTESVHTEADPGVFDARVRRRLPLSRCG